MGRRLAFVCLLGLATMNAHAASTCESILRGLVYDAPGDDRSPLYGLVLGELTRADRALQEALSRPRACQFGCELATGTWRVALGKPITGRRRIVASNRQTLSGTDPVYGRVEVRVVQDLVRPAIATPELRGRNALDDLGLSELFGIWDLGRTFLDPVKLTTFLDLTIGLGAGTHQLTLPVADSAAPTDDLGRFLVEGGFPERTGVRLTITRRRGFERLVLVGSTGAELELVQRGTARRPKLSTLRLTRQVRSARSTMFVTPSDGDLKAAARRFAELKARGGG